ncbi:helix-turn-helix domain-containing protein [Myxococcota bacterium]
MTPPCVQVRESTGGDPRPAVERECRERSSAPAEAGWPDTMLRWIRIGSTGAVVLVAGYAPYFPPVIGTSPTVSDLRIVQTSGAPRAGAPDATRYRELATMTAAEQAQEVLTSLGLTKSLLAEVLKVSRPTLYDWFNGAKEPNEANATRMATILRVLSRAGVSSTHPLNARTVRRPIDEDGEILLAQLTADHLDETRLEERLGEARSVSEVIRSRRINRESRLRDLGYDEPSNTQRRENLGQITAALSTPKR